MVGDIILRKCTKNYEEMIRFLRYGVRQTDRRTDGQTDKKVTYRGGCPT